MLRLLYCNFDLLVGNSPLLVSPWALWGPSWDVVHDARWAQHTKNTTARENFDASITLQRERIIVYTILHWVGEIGQGNTST